MSARRIRFVVLVASAVTLVVGIGSQIAGSAQALPPAQEPDIPGVTIPYPGRLDDEARQPVADGAYDFTFTLYGAETGGEPLWSEAQEGVAVQGGAFNILLGSAADIPAGVLDGSERWLAVGVRGPGEADFTDLTPRQRLSVASTLSPASPAAPTNGPACAHDHFGEFWSGSDTSPGLQVYNVSTSTYGSGIVGAGVAGSGVAGVSETGDGVRGASTNYGVYGVTSATGGTGAGVYGEDGGTNPDDSYAVYGKGDIRGSDDLYVNDDLTVYGYSTFSGGKSGYVVDVAQNDDIVSLEIGDIVVISGAGPAVVGEIPVIKVRRATAGETSAVVGVVDQHYAPAPQQMMAQSDVKSESIIENTAVAPEEYLTVVTLGSFKAIKADASYGAIAPGDLLVASPNPGYAMRATSPQPGTIIGKALEGLPSGTGVIPVIITLQ